MASGKGGTGKTFVASNLSVYIRKNLGGAVAVDADVEAPDLLLALGGSIKERGREEFYGSYTPVIDLSRCSRCGRCVEVCEYKAISMTEDGPVIDYAKCEGLGTCVVVCPSGAIRLVEEKTGEIYVSETRYGIPVVTGELELGKGNSGRLVYELKDRAYKLASEDGIPFRVVDAAPGIGCPVVSSIAGSDLLLIVVEPTPQSLKGSKRLLEVAENLRTDVAAIVNKYNLNPDYAAKIEAELGVELLGRIPYEDVVVEAYTSATPLLEYAPDSESSRSLMDCFESLRDGWLR